MKQQELKDALGRIEATDRAKEQIYNNVLRTAKDKKALSQKKVSFFKRRLDRAMPLAAACIVLLFCFCLWGVNSGAFFGSPVSYGQSMGATGADTQNVESQEATALNGGAAVPQDPVAEAGEEGGAMANRLPESGQKANETAPTVSVTAIAAIDVGFTAFEISDIPKDPFVFWDELLRVGAMPSAISLVGHNFESPQSLKLSFNSQLQTMMEASATDSLLVGIAKSFKAMYPEITELSFSCEGKPLVFVNKEVDGTELMERQISITDTKIISYGQAVDQTGE